VETGIPHLQAKIKNNVWRPFVNLRAVEALAVRHFFSPTPCLKGTYILIFIDLLQASPERFNSRYSTKKGGDSTARAHFSKVLVSSVLC